MATRAHTVPSFYLDGFTADLQQAGHDAFVYVGMVATGEIKRRSPKNLGIFRGLYDGAGALPDPNSSVEGHLAKIESAAAPAIRKLEDCFDHVDMPIPPEIWRFLSWQAARTPGWMNLVSARAAEWDPGAPLEVIEVQPDGFDGIRDRPRALLLELPTTGELRETADFQEFKGLIAEGWKWRLRNDDQLEMLHMQAWYFQVRHFPRLKWVRLNAPKGSSFVTSDRAVAWTVNDDAETPPAALRDSAAIVVAPLTSRIALVGRHGSEPFNATPRAVNRLSAVAATKWIAGCSHETVALAIRDGVATKART